MNKIKVLTVQNSTELQLEIDKILENENVVSANVTSLVEGNGQLVATISYEEKPKLLLS